MDVLGCFEGCLSHLATSDNLDLQQFKSLPAPALHVVKSSYTHCKASKTIINVPHQLLISSQR